jgi:chemotaxis protein MotB
MIPTLPPKKEETEDWLMSYADMITLLLAFFVLIIAMSHLDPVRYEEVEGGMAKAIGRHAVVEPMQQFKSEMAQALRGIKIDQSQVSIGSDDRGLVLDLDGNSFFDPASAHLKDEFLPALGKMAELLDSAKFSAFQVEVQGHTDNVPINTPTFPSNWDLSAARATAVVRILVADGVEPSRLGAVGYADTRPRVANLDLNGKPIPANQAINRRVSVHVYPR